MSERRESVSRQQKQPKRAVLSTSINLCLAKQQSPEAEEPRAATSLGTSSAILQMEKQLQQLQREREQLLASSEALMREQHKLENELEEVRVSVKRAEEKERAAKKRA